MSLYRNSSELPLQWSTSELLWFTTNRKGLPPFSLLQYFMGTLISWLPGFRSRWHICNSIGTTVCNDQKSPSMNDLQCGTVVSHVCLCFELASNATVQTYADVFLSFQLVVGKDYNPKNDFYKKSNRFGRNKYIYKKKCIHFEWKSFFRENYTCTLLFVGSFFMCVLTVSRNSTGELDMITHTNV